MLETSCAYPQYTPDGIQRQTFNQLSNTLAGHLPINCKEVSYSLPHALQTGSVIGVHHEMTLTVSYLLLTTLTQQSHSLYSTMTSRTSDSSLIRPLDVLEALDDLPLHVEVNSDLVHHVLFQHYGLLLQFTWWHCTKQGTTCSELAALYKARHNLYNGSSGQHSHTQMTHTISQTSECNEWSKNRSWSASIETRKIQPQ